MGAPVLLGDDETTARFAVDAFPTILIVAVLADFVHLVEATVLPRAR